MADLKAFAEQLVNLTVKEVNELAQILKDEYGIEPAAAAVAVAAGPAAGGEAAEEKSSFTTGSGASCYCYGCSGGFDAIFVLKDLCEFVYFLNSEVN